tara:strand:- start:1518 stop:3068 length:1551 start_codon:yes stop_codon:yes gene_type:complete
MELNNSKYINNNKIINNLTETINGVIIEIPNFDHQLQELNSSCVYDEFNIPKLSSIINEKQMNEIQKINKNRLEDNQKTDNFEINQNQNQNQNSNLNIFYKKIKDYYEHQEKYEEQVLKIIENRRNLFLEYKKKEWVIDYKIKKRKILSEKYNHEISKLEEPEKITPKKIKYTKLEQLEEKTKLNYQNENNNKNINKNIKENENKNGNEKVKEPIKWVFLSYNEYKSQYKPSFLLTCKKIKDNFQYLHNIRLRVIQDRNKLNFELNTLLKLIQSKKKELNNLFDRLKIFENHKKQLFEKLVFLRNSRVKELLTKSNNNSILNFQIDSYSDFQNKMKKDLINDLKNKNLNYESISILKYDTPDIINQVKEIKKFINTRQIEKIKKNIMETKKQMNATYLQNFKDRLLNDFHINPHLINKIRNTYPLIYKNKEAFQSFKYQILNNQIKTLNKIKNDNQKEIAQLYCELEINKSNIQQCLQNLLHEDPDFKHIFQYYKKVIEKKEQHLLRAYRNYKKSI